MFCHGESAQDAMKVLFLAWAFVVSACMAACYCTISIKMNTARKSREEECES